MRRQCRSLAALATVLLAVAVAACGDDDGSTDAGDEGEAAGVAATESTAAPSTTLSVPPEEQAWNDLVAATEVVTEVSGSRPRRPRAGPALHR